MKKVRVLIQGVLILVSMCFFLFNCGSSSSPAGSSSSKSKQALKYNDNLVKYQRSLEKKIIALNAALKRQDPLEIDAKLTELQEHIGTTADFISQIAGFDGDTGLRDAFLDQLEFYESLYSQEGKEMIEGFISDPPAENLKELTKNFSKRIDTEGDKVEKKLISVQQAFLRKYKLKR